MQLLIERLAFKDQFNLSAVRGCLLLALPDSAERLLIAGLSGERIGVSHCLADGETCLSCDTDMVFLIVEDELQPVELLHTEAVWAAYEQVMVATGAAQVQDGEGNFDLACFAEFWAEQLTQQRWLEAGQRLYV
jgi:hypothetical protein